MDHVDVVIVGAGISGIGAAYHLQKRCPGKSYTILEGRDAVGGTWDLFKYPGIRSDSDMHTFGYAFRPWPNKESIASAPAILKYLNDTAQENGIDKKIRFKHQVIGAEWSSEAAQWTVSVRTPDGGTDTITCQFLFMCTGYYNYDHGYFPDFPGMDRFQGRIIHPQKWTADTEYAGEKVVVIGSGATAVTIVPVMAEKAAHVTMLQRSPSYVAIRPMEDVIEKAVRRWLPKSLTYSIIRWKNILFTLYFFNLSRKNPEKAKEFILGQVREALGPDYDIDTHFTPSYNVWDQRVCMVPDGDLFQSIRAGKVSMVTDHIETFTETGLRLTSGEELEADLIIPATGLELQLLSGIPITVDGSRINPSKSFQYKGVMFSDIPNLAWTIGYTNSSWTLKADLTSEYVARLIKTMDRKGAKICTPRLKDPEVEAVDFFDFSSGYVQRSKDILPKQGSKFPWRLRQNYLLDIFILRFSRIEDGTMELR